MLTSETIERIWHCMREIEAGNKLLADMEEVGRQDEKRWEGKSKTEPTLKDAFGRRRHLELGVPSGENGHRIFQVSPILAGHIIRAHIANKTAELAEANELARLELICRTGEETKC